MSINVSMMENEAAERVGDLKLMRIKIWDLPADTVALSVERRRDKPKFWVLIQASFIKKSLPQRSFFSTTLGKRWKVQFRKRFSQFNNIDSKIDIKNNNKLLCEKDNQLWTCNRNTIYIYIH